MGIFNNKWNKNNFSIYKSEEKTVLKLIEKLNNFIGELSQGVDGKTDITGDHKGTWQGLKPTQTDIGLSSLVEKINEDVEKINEKIVTVITPDDENIQELINHAKDKVVFRSGIYNINEVISLKSDIEYDGGNAIFNFKNSFFSIPTGAKNIIIKNFNLVGDLKYTKITEVYNNGKQIKCENNVFEIGDIIGCSNYGITDQPSIEIISKTGDLYNLDKAITTDGSLLDNSWGAVVGNFKWGSLINGEHNTNNILIENCSFKFARGYAIAIPNSDDVKIKNCIVENNGLDFILFSAENRDRKNLLIENCTFKNSIDFGKQGIVITKVDGIYYKNIDIIGCVFDNISESAVSLGYARGYLQDVNIERNVIKNCKLFGIHTSGKNVTIKNNEIYNCLMGIRIGDVTSEVFNPNSYFSDYNISNNNISCGNGIIITNVTSSSGGYLIPMNINILDNNIQTDVVAIESCGINNIIKGNIIKNLSSNPAPYFSGSIFIGGSENRSIKIIDNIINGRPYITWINTFDLLIKDNSINTLKGNSDIRISSVDYPNLQANMHCIIKDNVIYKGSTFFLTTNDGKDQTEFSNNKIIDGNNVKIVPYMKGKPARYEMDGDGGHWLDNTNNSWIITKDNYFISGNKFGYIASDGTLKVTDNISDIS